jgi:hypothetical protein
MSINETVTLTAESWQGPALGQAPAPPQRKISCAAFEGVWGRLMDAFVQAHDGGVQMIDTSVVRVHQRGATAKGASRSISVSLPRRAFALAMVGAAGVAPVAAKELSCAQIEAHNSRVFLESASPGEAAAKYLMSPRNCIPKQIKEMIIFESKSEADCSEGTFEASENVISSFGFKCMGTGTGETACMKRGTRTTFSLSWHPELISHPELAAGGSIFACKITRIN